MLWIPFTLFASSIQTVRTGLQKSLSKTLTPELTTWIRSGFGLPICILYVGGLLLSGQHIPTLSIPLIGMMAIAAITQLLGTYGMIILFSKRNFSVSIAYTKAEALHTAILGSLLFSEHLSPLGWLSICIGVCGIITLSFSSANTSAKTLLQTLSLKHLGIGSISAISFALTSLFIRKATLLMDSTAITNAATVLIGVLTLQFFLLGSLILIRQPSQFKTLIPQLPKALLVGLTSCLGSIGWFTAYALTNPAYVKTLGQTELLFSILITRHVFKEKLTPLEYTGLGLTLVSILLIVTMTIY